MLLVVGVEGDVVHLVVRVRQDSLLPGPERRHAGVGTSAGNQLDVRVHEAHGLGCFLRQAAVFLGGLVADLPRPVHLVAQAPELDIERILVAVPGAEVRPVAAAGVVGVFHYLAGRVHSPGAQVDGFHDFRTGLAGPVHEFMQAERVGLHSVPGAVQTAGPVLPRADAVFPVITGDEVAAGVPDDGGAEFLDELEDVKAEAVLICFRVAGFIDAGVNAAAHVLHEGAEEAAGYFADGEIAVEGNPCAGHVLQLLGRGSGLFETFVRRGGKCRFRFRRGPSSQRP